MRFDGVNDNRGEFLAFLGLPGDFDSVQNLIACIREV